MQFVRGLLPSFCWSSVELSFPAGNGSRRRRKMGLGRWGCLLAFLFHFSVVSAETNAGDAAALQAVGSAWPDKFDWVGSDPCGSKWVGIGCNDSRVVSIKLSSMGLTGEFPRDILSLSELQILDFSFNPGLTGSLPPSIGGSLTKLTNLVLVGCNFSGSIPDLSLMRDLYFLSLNSNQFTGGIPPTIGNLLNLFWLDIGDNQLTGVIPVSSGNIPGLDKLINTEHFHFSKNKLSGSIPERLFSSGMSLKHVLFDGNDLSGRIPSTLGLVKNLEVLRLDRNSLTGAIPPNINNLTNVKQLYLSNNRLTGPLPNLTGMNALCYLDLSNNTFEATVFPSWFSTLQSLTTLVMEYSRIENHVPVELFSLPDLQAVRLRDNSINGTLDLGTGPSRQLQLVDVQFNQIEYVFEGGYKNELRLKNNPFCDEKPDDSHCTAPPKSALPYSTPPPACGESGCPSDQKLSPHCRCAYPYVGILYFKAPSFSDINNANYSVLENALQECFQTEEICYMSEKVPVDSVAIINVFTNWDNYLQINLQIFPEGELRFTQSQVSSIGFILGTPTFKAPDLFGPYSFKPVPYDAVPGGGGTAPGSKSKGLPVIIGASLGGLALVLILIGLAVYNVRRKRKADQDRGVIDQSQPFAFWDASKSSCSVPQLTGPRGFSFEELKQCTDNFSEANEIGSGGYGKVYRGMLQAGQLIAIKRAQQGSMQGGLEFKTEIELLSRVHHNNLVSLVGFCFDQGEQMLVYEYIPNGTLKESLSGKTGVRLDWRRRLRVALGAARGLAYLHEHASPPIIHRDVKSSNILLDDRLNAKVADFGLSRPMGDDGKDHVTTQVKGTMGYMDPEYYMSQQLTEKSDVYSFGVLMLELLTARKPIEKGRYVVREVKILMDKTKDLYGLHEMLDLAIGLGTSLPGFERFVDLALSCVAEAGADRPAMSEVVREIEAIMNLAGLNPNSDSTQTSASFEVSAATTASGEGHREHPYAIRPGSPRG